MTSAEIIGLEPASRRSGMQMIHDLLIARRWKAARAAVRDLPESTKDYERALAEGVVELLSRHPHAADELAEIEVPADDLSARWLLGRCLALAARVGEALPHLQAILNVEPDNPRLNYLVGRVALRARAYDVARDAFGRALKRDPNNLAALRGLGIAEFRSNAWEPAVQAFEEAGARIRDDPTSLGFLGFAKMMLDDGDDEAEQLILKALALRPGWYEARVRYGDLLLRQDRFSEAEAVFVRLTSDYPSLHWPRYFRAIAAHLASRDLEPLTDVKRALRRLRKDDEGYEFLPLGLAAGWYKLGRLYIRSGETQQAIAPLKNAVDMAPRRRRYRLHYATVLIEQQQYPAAIATLRGYRKSDPANDARATLLLGMCLMETGRLEEARAAFEESCSTDPLSTQAFLALARASSEFGDLERAEQALATAYRTGRRQPEISEDIHDLEVRLGRPIDYGAGLGELTDFQIPREFQLDARDPGLGHVGSLWRGLASHYRAISAIMHRRILARYGRNQLGYLWAIVYPMIYVATLDVAFRVIHRSVPLGVTMEQFLITGIVPMVCFFMAIKSQILTAVSGHKNLLYFREVTTLNVVIAVWVLETLTAMVTMGVILIGMYFAGQPIAIHDLGTLLLALVMISLLAAELGGIMAAISLRFHSVQFAGQAINRVLFLLSGAFFYAGELPPERRELFFLNPLFHLIEYVRAGFFKGYESIYSSWQYPLMFIIPGLLLLLVTDRVFRRYVFDP